MPNAPDPTTLEPAILRSLDRLTGRAPEIRSALAVDVDAAYLAAGCSPGIGPRLDVAQALARGIDAQRRLADAAELLRELARNADWEKATIVNRARHLLEKWTR